MSKPPAKRLRRILRRALWSGLATAAAAGLAFAILWLAFPFDPDPLYRIPAGTTWHDRSGVPLRVRLADGGLDSVPGYAWREDDWIGKAVVAAEDRRFWQHHGVDPLAAARAVRQTASAMRRVSGASTLSMQLIRMSWPRPRTLPGKLIEAFRALQMERQLGKREILSLYLDRAPFGSNVTGVEAAARRYFGKGAHDLTLAEAALLAGIPQAPTRFHPARHPEAARRRQAYVLERMAALGMITAEQLANARAQPLQVRPNRYPFHAPHFCDMLVRQPAAATTVVPTTLDLHMQLTVEEALAKRMPELAAAGIHGAAVVVLDVPSGGVRALVGSPDFRAPVRGAQVNAALAPRSAGSTLKPFVYAMALERGTHTPLRVLFDVPERFSDYEPLNFDKAHRGLVTMRDALVDSLNLPAVQVEREVGQPRLHALLRDLGLHTLSRPAGDYGLGLVLGNAEVTLLDLTNAYACLARGGAHLPWRISPAEASPQTQDGKIQDARLRKADRTALNSRFQESSGRETGTRVFSAETCWLVADMLGGDERAMDSTGTVADIRIAPFAWKTGTSSGFRDAWTIAFNPEFAIGVWLGNPDGRPSRALLGSKAAAPLVWEISRRLYPDGNGPWFPKPAAVESREVCAVSGQTPCPNCPRTIRDHAVKGVTRYQMCDAHRFSAEAVWPPRVAEFLRARGAADGTAGESGLAITSPAAGSVYLFMPAAHPASRQSIPLTATAGDPAATLHWFVNDQYIGEARSGDTLFWEMRVGSHRVVCSDSRGASRSVRIVVNDPRGHAGRLR